MKKFIKIVKTFLNIVMTVIIILGTLFIALFCFGIQPYIVESGSMSPEIETGSICFINKKADYNEMNVGDIIAFKLDTGAFVTHRIYAITEEGFTTKGDANLVIDNVITTKDNFIGKNVLSIPKAGFVVKAIQRGKILVATVIIVIFLAAILIGEPSKRKKEDI